MNHNSSSSHFHTGQNASPGTRSSREGFTLVEMLAVLAIIAILIGMAGSVASKLGTSEGVDNAVSALQSQVANAQQLAKSRGVPTRVLILNKSGTSSDDRDRYLNYIQVVYLSDEDDGGSPVWKPEGNGVSLPTDARFSTEYSSGELSFDQQSEGASGPELGGKMGVISQNDWLSYGFNSTGSPINPRVNDRLDLIIQGSAGIDASGEMQVREKFKKRVGGFALTRYGNTLRYRDAAHIGKIIGEDLVGSN